MINPFSTLSFEVSDGIGHIVLNQPPSNEMTLSFFSEFALMTDQLRQMKDLKGILISGKGRHFSSGARLSELLSLSSENSMEFYQNGSSMSNFLEENNRSFLFFEECTIPVVSAIRGACLGSAFELTLFSHFRFCGNDSVFGLPESTFNLIPGIGGISRLNALTGTAAALEIVLRGNTFSAEEALRLNLIDRIFPRKEVVNLSKEFLKSLPGNYHREKSRIYLRRFMDEHLTSQKSF